MCFISSQTQLISNHTFQGPFKVNENNTWLRNLFYYFYKHNVMHIIFTLYSHYFPMFGFCFLFFVKTRSVPTNHAPAYPFSKGTHNQKDVLSSIARAEVSKSVGLIHIDGQPAGTGFRVGEKYLVTCGHVIQNVIKGQYLYLFESYLGN